MSFLSSLLHMNSHMRTHVWMIPFSYLQTLIVFFFYNGLANLAEQLTFPGKIWEEIELHLPGGSQQQSKRFSFVSKTTRPERPVLGGGKDIRQRLIFKW